MRLKKSLSAILIVVSVFILASVGAKGFISLETGTGVEYLLGAVITMMLILLSACNFDRNTEDEAGQKRRRKSALFLVAALLFAMISGVSTFIVAGFVAMIVVPFCSKELLQWFAGFLDAAE